MARSVQTFKCYTVCKKNILTYIQYTNQLTCIHTCTWTQLKLHTYTYTHIYIIYIYAFMYTQILMVPIFEQGFNLKEAFRSQNLRVDRDWQVHEHELSEDYKTRRNKIAPHQGSQSSSANHATISTYAPTTIYCKSHIHTYIHTYILHT